VPATYALRVDPQPARSGARVRLSLERVRARAELAEHGRTDRVGGALRVAWRLDPLHTAFGRAQVEHRFLPLGRQRVDALVIGEDGRVQRLRRDVVVETARASSCASAVRTRESSGAWWLWPALWLVQRRGRRKRRRARRPGIDCGANPVLRGLTVTARTSLIACSGIARALRGGAMATNSGIARALRGGAMAITGGIAPALRGGAMAMLLVLAGSGCAHQNIPNTHVEDTSENREIIEFVERYRKAVEDRDIVTLLNMTSRFYFDDMGTPTGDDDVDFDGLKLGLERMRKDVLAARYQISYRGLTYTPNDRVLVDLLYTGWFKVETANGAQWRRRLEPHRMVLAREDGKLLIVSGM
jgi:hypothetical protein